MASQQPLPNSPLSLWAGSGFLIALLSIFPDAIRSSWSQLLETGMSTALYVAIFVLSVSLLGGLAGLVVGLIARPVLRSLRWRRGHGFWVWIASILGCAILIYPQSRLCVHYYIIGYTPFAVTQPSAAYAPVCAILSLLAGIIVGTVGFLISRLIVARTSSLWVMVALLVSAFAFATGFHQATHSHDTRRVLFNRTTLMGRVLGKLDMLWDLDGDTFAPTWLGGGDTDDANSDIHPLTVWAQEHPAPESYSQPDPDPVEGVPRPLNILLISDDTLRADHLGCYGYPIAISPVIDSLATRGVLFERCLVPKPKTSPSLASLLTGKPPTAHNVRLTGHKLSEDHLTLAEILAANGYMTCGITRNGVVSAKFGFDQGFHYFLHQKGRLESAATDSALAWLEGRWLNTTESRSRRGRPPFFLWIHYLDPHGRYDMPRPYEETPLDDMEGQLLRNRYPERVLRWLIPPYQRHATNRVAHYIAQYNGEISSVDREVKRLLEWLRARRLDGTTLIIFTSDHGESFTEHDFYFEHGDVAYDDNARVPLIICLPGVFPEGQRVSAQVNNIDIFPTITNLVEIPPLPGLEGHNLSGLLLGETWTKPRPIHILANYVGRYSPRYFTNAMCDGRWKIIYTPEFHILELYDLVSDPLELRNLWGRWDEDPTNGRWRAAGIRLRSLLAQQMLADKAGQRREAARETGLSKDLMEQLRSLGYIN